MIRKNHVDPYLWENTNYDNLGCWLRAKTVFLVLTLLLLLWFQHAGSASWNVCKNSLYIFGGGDAEKDGAIRRSRSVNRFYKINFPDMPCSLGTYELNNECVPCPKGTYKDTYGSGACISCAVGMYNE